MKTSGILLPIFSLPSEYGVGCFSKDAYHFVDFLKNTGQQYWQILPLGTITVGNSPYLSFSSHAGSRIYIDPEQLVDDDLLTMEEVEAYRVKNTGKVDYKLAKKIRSALLNKAYGRFRPTEDYKSFLVKNQYWLEEYAKFMVERKHNHPVEYYRFVQYIFLKQWMKLKKYANDSGISIVGDLPFYVAFEGTDFRYHKELFKTNEEGVPVVVGGCPPDSFAKDGQVWANPVYDWDYHKKTGYRWWMERLRHCFLLYDVLRLDHFRGFDEYYEIPAGEETAVNGHWEKGPGYDFFHVMKGELGDRRIVAEDLGFLNDGVRELLSRTEYPGMKILEFAFGAWDDSDYLPHKYPENCVAYTGTHDNETIMGWYENMSEEDKQFLENYLEHSSIERTGKMNLDMISLALESRARCVIIPLQDYLGLDNEARINTPSTVGGNWEWRFKKEDITYELQQLIYKLNCQYRP